MVVGGVVGSFVGDRGTRWASPQALVGTAVGQECLSLGPRVAFACNGLRRSRQVYTGSGSGRWVFWSLGSSVAWAIIIAVMGQCFGSQAVVLVLAMAVMAGQVRPCPCRLCVWMVPSVVVATG